MPESGQCSLYTWYLLYAILMASCSMPVGIGGVGGLAMLMMGQVVRHGVG